jgi:hypothetical protein
MWVFSHDSKGTFHIFRGPSHAEKHSIFGVSGVNEINHDSSVILYLAKITPGYDPGFGVARSYGSGPLYLLREVEW